MRAKLETAIQLGIKATAAGGQTEGSNLINLPGSLTDGPAVKDLARKRLVKTNPDVDAAKTQDTKYGFDINEYDTSSEAEKAALARPYTRVTRGK